MKVKDLIIMILENKIPYNIKISYLDTIFKIDDLIETYGLRYIAEKYVSIIYEKGEDKDE